MNQNISSSELLTQPGISIADNQNLYALLCTIESIFYNITEYHLPDFEGNEKEVADLFEWIIMIRPDLKKYRSALYKRNYDEIAAYPECPKEQMIFRDGDDVPFRLTDIRLSPLEKYDHTQSFDMNAAAEAYRQGCLIYVSQIADGDGDSHHIEIYPADCPDEIFLRYRRMAGKGAETCSYTIEKVAERFYVTRLSNEFSMPSKEEIKSRLEPHELEFYESLLSKEIFCDDTLAENDD